jgi:hypothetical protein
MYVRIATRFHVLITSTLPLLTIYIGMFWCEEGISKNKRVAARRFRKSHPKARQSHLSWGALFWQYILQPDMLSNNKCNIIQRALALSKHKLECHIYKCIYRLDRMSLTPKRSSMKLNASSMSRKKHTTLSCALKWTSYKTTSSESNLIDLSVLCCILLVDLFSGCRFIDELRERRHDLGETGMSDHLADYSRRSRLFHDGARWTWVIK